MADPREHEELADVNESIDAAYQAADAVPDDGMPEDLRNPDYFSHLQVPGMTDAEAWAAEPHASDFTPEADPDAGTTERLAAASDGEGEGNAP